MAWVGFRAHSTYVDLAPILHITQIPNLPAQSMTLVLISLVPCCIARKMRKMKLVDNDPILVKLQSNDAALSIYA